MSEHVGYIIQIKELNKHPNADRLQIATIFGASVIVDLSVKIDDIGVYFPIDLQLSEEYCNQNNLTRKLDSEGNNIGGYLDPNKRNIRAMRFRGSKSEGLYMPLDSLFYTGITSFEIGDKINILNKHEICKKYLPHNGHILAAAGKQGNRTRKKKVPIAPLFAEHADTEQLAYNLGDFQIGDLVEITLKMHGTSSRIGYLPVLQGYKKTLLDRILRREGTPIYKWDYISGTRRCILSSFDGGFYGNNQFRKQYEDFFRGRLHKGEEVFGEIVGFIDKDLPIMPSVSNEKTKDKDFIKQYGKTTIFSYGCSDTGVILQRGEDYEGTFYIPKKVPQSDFYVYRMTYVNEDGDTIEYPPDYMRYRCEQMGVKYVPLLWRGIIPKNTWVDTHSAGEWIKNIAENYYDGPDPIGKTHVREGVVVRIVNRPKFCAFKYKNWYFKCIEGIIKNDAVEPDIEEKEELYS